MAIRQTNLSERPLRRRPWQPAHEHLGAFRPTICMHTSTAVNAQRQAHSHTNPESDPRYPRQNSPGFSETNYTTKKNTTLGGLTLLVVVPLRRRPPILKVAAKEKKKSKSETGLSRRNPHQIERREYGAGRRS